MSEFLRIGVVCKDHPPQVFSERVPADAAWRIEFLDESDIVSTPVAPRRGFLAVFFPADEMPEFWDYLARVFPGAEIVGYSLGADGEAEPMRMDGERLTLRWPMSITLAAYLFESIRILQAARLDQALIRGHEEDLRTFFEAFVGVVDTSGSGADRHQGMSALLGKIIRRLCAEQALIYLSDEAGMNLVRAYESGGFKDLDMFEHQANSAIVDQVLKDGTPYIDNDCRFDIKIPFSSESCAVRSILCLPLTYRARKIGVVEVLNKSDGAFTEEDRKLLEMMARPISVAVNTISRFDKAERLTITDDLTKLYNYRFLMQYLEAEVKRCLRYKKKVSLLFVDVDGFKQVNDTFGHLVGSLALAEMGQVLLKSLRETDVVGRYGGDEFVIVLPETPLNGALVIAERIRKKIEDYEFVAQDLSIRLTVSLGVANCPRHTLTAEGLIKKADAAMYRAKELTKNSIKVAV